MIQKYAMASDVESENYIALECQRLVKGQIQAFFCFFI